MGISLRGEFAKDLLHNIAPLKAILDVVEGELFQSRNVVLNKCHSNVLPAEEKWRKPYLQDDKPILGTVEGLSPRKLKRSRRSSIRDYSPIHRVQTLLNQCRDRTETPGTCQVVRGYSVDTRSFT